MSSRYSDSREQYADLRKEIDSAAAKSSSLWGMMDELRRHGIAAVPSVNSRGLNGMSYRWQGQQIKGSSVGRAYTAKGLRDVKGLAFDPARDLAGIRELQRQPMPEISKVAVSNDAGASADRSRKGKDRHRTKDRDNDPRRRDATGFSPDQWKTLMEIGKYRMVRREDLIRNRYEGHEMRFRGDIQKLREAGFTQQLKQMTKYGHEISVLVLTKEGRKEAMKYASTSGVDGLIQQRFWAHLVKPQELTHDAGIYRMGAAETRAIEAAGGRVIRVVTDYELKREFWKALNKGRTSKDGYRGADYRARKQEVARDLGLAIVDGRVVLPDLRLEYIDEHGERQTRDLELATGDYKRSQLAAKKKAGLKIYGPDTALGGTPWSEREYEHSR